MSQFKALFLQGIQTWLSDKQKLRLQLVYWPLLLPCLFLVFIVLSVAVMSSRMDSVSVGNDVNPSIKIGLTPGPYYKAIETVFNLRLGYDVIPLTREEMQEQISSSKILFGIENTQEGERIKLTLIYDRQRDYVDKHWIDDTKHAMADISHAIHSSHIGLPIRPGNGLPTVSLELDAYGQSGGVSVAFALMFLFFMVLVVYPLDIAKSVLNQVCIEDLTHGQLQLLNNAKVSPLTVLISRWSATVSVYVVSMLVLCVYCLAFMMLYSLFSHAVAQHADPSLLQQPKLYPFILGFNEFYESLSFIQIFNVLLGFIFCGSLVLSVLTVPALKSAGLEQARARSKIIDIAVFNVPIMAYIFGAAAPSNWLPYIPVLNHYHLALLSANGYSISPYLYLSSILTATTIIILVILNLQKKVFTNSRV